MGEYPLLDILDAGTWNNSKGKPALFELIPQVRNDDGKSDQKTLERDIELLLYHARVLIYDPAGWIRKALAMQKGNEDDQSGDSYDFIVQGLTYADVKDIFNDTRDILDTYVTDNPSAIYNDFTLNTIILQAGLGDFVYRFNVEASLAGLQKEVPS